VDFVIKPNIKWKDLIEDIASRLNIKNFRVIRIFNSKGMEILEEDIELV
jgi:hypothetical protein